MELGVTEALMAAENALRDFLMPVLRDAYGEDWPSHCHVKSARVKEWKWKRDEAMKHPGIPMADNRLLYYSTVWDLSSIVEKNHHLPIISAVFGEITQFVAIMTLFKDLRNAETHRREFLPYEKSLANGIAGVIRGYIVRYRSKNETGEDYFPRIESVRDDVRGLYVAGDSPLVVTGCEMRVGQTIDFVVTASDPKDEDLEYAIFKPSNTTEERGWSSSNTRRICLTERDIGMQVGIKIAIRSKRKYHAYHAWDDLVSFEYRVLPEE